MRCLLACGVHLVECAVSTRSIPERIQRLTIRRGKSETEMRRNFCIAAVLLGTFSHSSAADLTIRLSNASGASLSDAVVFVSETASAASAASAARKRESIVQRERVFVPFVTVVETGTSIAFPNDDPMLHNVYSFSPAKRFEIRLYKGTPVAPVVFDKTGVVVLGCNVHDWMLGYVVVVDSPFFAKSGKDGVLRLTVPAGTHQLMVWYPGMREPALLQSIALTATESRSIDHRLQVNIRTQPTAPPLDPMRYSRFKGRPSMPGADVCVSPDS